MRRAALTGMDGGPQLRAALDATRQRERSADVVIVDNGRRGPCIIDTRGLDHDVVDGLIPAGVIAAIADLDDPPPATLLENGFDVVLLLETRGHVIDGEDVMLRTYFHPRLGGVAPAPFRARFNGATWEKAA